MDEGPGRVRVEPKEEGLSLHTKAHDELGTIGMHDVVLKHGEDKSYPAIDSLSSQSRSAKEAHENTGQGSSTLDISTKSTFLSDDETLFEESNPLKSNKITIEDWSETGRGSHVDFEKEETVSLQQGRWLGRGITGDVYETTVQGWQVAHKKLLVKRAFVDKAKREIEILKRLSSHMHIIQLIGTYTYGQFLGMLIYPVAICDGTETWVQCVLSLRYVTLYISKSTCLHLAEHALTLYPCPKMHTFFEDVEAWSAVASSKDTQEARLDDLDSTHKARLNAIGYTFPNPSLHSSATPIYSRLGCLISAIAYLHDQKIRHKDLKPSNILLSRDNLWLSDFGSATDFSLLSQSATDNERGTLRYFSPEVAAWKPNGRAADVFSLGCVLLEIVVLHDRGTLEHIRKNRSPDPSFHANLDRVETWCTMLKDENRSTKFYLLQEIKMMLMEDSGARPSAHELLIRVTGYDLADDTSSKQSIFGQCCTNLFVSNQQRTQEIASFKTKFSDLQVELTNMFERTKELMQQDFDQISRQHMATMHSLQESLQKHHQEQRLTLEKLAESKMALEKEREARLADVAKMDRILAEKKNAERAMIDLNRKLSIAQEESQGWQKVAHRKYLPYQALISATQSPDSIIRKDESPKEEPSSIATRRSLLAAVLDNFDQPALKPNGAPYTSTPDTVSNVVVASNLSDDRAAGRDPRTTRFPVRVTQADPSDIRITPRKVMFHGKQPREDPLHYISPPSDKPLERRDFWDQRPSDYVIENEFRKLMVKRGWYFLPENTRRQIEAYKIDQKWTIVYQDKLAEFEEKARQEAIVEGIRTGNVHSYSRSVPNVTGSANNNSGITIVVPPPGRRSINNTGIGEVQARLPEERVEVKARVRRPRQLNESRYQAGNERRMVVVERSKRDLSPTSPIDTMEESSEEEYDDKQLSKRDRSHASDMSEQDKSIARAESRRSKSFGSNIAEPGDDRQTTAVSRSYIYDASIEGLRRETQQEAMSRKLTEEQDLLSKTRSGSVPSPFTQSSQVYSTQEQSPGSSKRVMDFFRKVGEKRAGGR